MEEVVDGEEEGRFAELVGMCAIAQVTYGTDREDDTNVWKRSVEVVDEGRPIGENIFHRKTLSNETGGEFVVTVTNHHTGVGKAVNPGSAESDEEYIGVAQVFGGACKDVVVEREGFFRRGTREEGVAEPRAVSLLSERLNLFRLERLVVEQAGQNRGDAERIVECTERVDLCVEPSAKESFADVVGETRTE